MDVHVREVMGGFFLPLQLQFSAACLPDQGTMEDLKNLKMTEFI